MLNLVVTMLRRKYMPLRKCLQFEYNLFNTILGKPIMEKPLWCYFVKRGTCLIPLESYKKVSEGKKNQLSSKYNSKKSSRNDLHNFGMDQMNSWNPSKPFEMQGTHTDQNFDFFGSFEEVCAKVPEWSDFDTSEYLLMNNEFGSSVWELRPLTRLKVPYYKELQDEVIEPDF
jgi:hypothetical protein